MNLETERLFMRPVTARDGDALHRLHTDPLVVELIMQGKPLTRAESDARLSLYLNEWDRYGYGFWMVYLREANGDLTFVGRAGLRRYDENDVEVGVCLFGSCSGKGIAGESLEAAIKFGFRRLPVRRLVCVVRPTNIRSQKAMLRLGFSFTGMTEHLGTFFRFYEMQRPGKFAL
ncbi:Acetyltransferase, ribosomal protein N-acetylase (plasmid) [Neorhizobium galegae bv. officinalis bv. officinalis str. HAMBI 1141]|jgi:[ribosomal protein S5]-alanine N-acetyltransferase|uniref:Acetyltransferase, ribosomal protein N-acetylase n=1 Tax=Neorhizobium galegae bv. officinalis bv. officinalis str. HAMBI 1141 TaxID=1028801 RepID=A0A068TLL5_NEOGA|nr:GNAT family N-acetyltransferase [Neorhizobium galegae]CDN58455.1 Acetyltransferase, ribosomal protein N-acetylase [Neorhizobium galegae bv. officinalis bv. officinalis str. HAMBI 1141]